jgi:hypothetical protein
MDSRGASAGLVADPRGQCEVLAERARIELPHIARAREHTRARVAQLEKAFGGEDLAAGLSVCVFGSWAREELTPDSDDDWAVLTGASFSPGDGRIASAAAIAQRHLGAGEQAPGTQGVFGASFDVAGLIGNPTAFPQCTVLQFNTFLYSGINECPPDTAMGVVIVTVDEPTSLHVFTTTAPIFNLEPSHGEPARFGFFVATTVPVILETSVRTGGGYGVTVSANNINENAALLAAHVIFWGVPGAAAHNQSRGWPCELPNAFFAAADPCAAVAQPQAEAFLTLPTSCTNPLSEPLMSTIEADSWPKVGPEAEPSHSSSLAYTFQDSLGQPFGMTGCNRLDFSPEIEVKPDVQDASTPTGLTVEVHVPQDAALNPNGTAEATVKDTTVTLPEGVTLNPGGADGLEACSETQIGFQGKEEEAGVMATNVFTPTLGEPFCPAGSKVGTVEIETPLLPHALKGAVYLATPAPFGEAHMNPFRSLIAMYIVAQDPVSGVLVKLPGKVVPDLSTGRLTSTFEDTPELPFENLILHFFGGSRAPLSTPPSCGAYTTQASFTPWSGNEPVPSSSTFDVTSGPNGGPCANPRPFAPGFNAQSTNIQAGAFTPFTTTMSRPDADQPLGRLSMKLAPGLLGSLSSVKLCPEPQANEGKCGPESLIGHTIVSAGLGSNPVTVKRPGEVFITGPYEGAPYGLSIVNPAEAGPFNLGNVIVRAKIEVDPLTAQLTVSTDPPGSQFGIPTILKGIPLQLQHVNVTVDRPNFTFNPTSCGHLAIAGTMSSSEGATAPVSTPFQVTNCAILAFKPTFKVSTSGKTSRKNGASLDVKLTYPRGAFGKDANIRSVKVNLPKQLPSRLTTLQKACLDTVFNANPASCPAASRVGSAMATTPLLPVPLNGPAYFVSHGGAKFPELVIVLSGYGTTVQLHGETFISKKGITSSTFRTVPDVPVGTFELKLPQGPYSALAANGKLCKSKLRMPTAFVAQNGAVIHQSTKIAVSGCPKTKKKGKKGVGHKK